MASVAAVPRTPLGKGLPLAQRSLGNWQLATPRAIHSDTVKKSTLTLVIVLGTLGVLALAAIVGAVGYFAVNGISSRPASDEEKKLVVDAAALVEYGADVDPACGKYTTTRSLDATTEIRYECDGETVYILSTAEVSPNVRDARQTFVINIGAYKAGIAIGDATLQRRDALLGDLGEDRYAALIGAGGKNAGNLFMVRQGRVVHSVMITGLYFDEADAAQELLTPVIAASGKRYAKKR